MVHNSEENNTVGIFKIKVFTSSIGRYLGGYVFVINRTTASGKIPFMIKSVLDVLPFIFIVGTWKILVNEFKILNEHPQQAFATLKIVFYFFFRILLTQEHLRRNLIYARVLMEILMRPMDFFQIQKNPWVLREEAIPLYRRLKIQEIKIELKKEELNQ